MTRTPEEVTTPTSGAGVDYQFGHVEGTVACAPHDRALVSISVTGAPRDASGPLELELLRELGPSARRIGIRSPP